MPVRSIKVWNASASAWEGVGVEAPDFGAFVGASLFNAKGDLLTATANDTPAILTAGSNGQILMADSSATAGLRYVDPPASRSLAYNGAMQVHQRGTSVTGISSGDTYHTADRWQTQVSSLGTWTQSIENDAPTGSGLRKSLKMLATTADASPAAGGYALLTQKFEGQDVQHIKKGTASAEQLSVSFWVKSNVTGTYVVELRDADNSRTVSATYSVSASATWEKKTITFPADTTGALDNDNARSFDLNFWLGAGTNFTSGTLATTWASTTTANRAVGQTNLAAATNNYWQVTGVQLETGPVATPFEFEPYEATLRKCQRYYYRYGTEGAFESVAVGQAVTTDDATVLVHHPVEMRAKPTVSTPDAALWAVTTSAFSNNEVSSFTVNAARQSKKVTALTAACASTTLTAGNATFLTADNSSSAVLEFSAEL